MSSSDSPAQFGDVLGIAPFGVVAYSCGPAEDKVRVPREFARSTDNVYVTGVKWEALEFARRYMAMSKGVMLPEVPTATNLFDVQRAPYVGVGGGHAPVAANDNGAAVQKPEAGDLLVWERCVDYPFGHVAVITRVEQGMVYVAEQGIPGAARWPAGRNYSREFYLKALNGRYFVTEDSFDTTGRSILGWLHFMWPDVDPATSDIADRFRHPVGSGRLLRVPIERDLSLPWIDTRDGRGFFLRRSLVPEGHSQATHPEEVPSGYYVTDFDLWQKIRLASNELHPLFVEATRKIVADPASGSLLSSVFGIPEALHDRLRASLAFPAFAGRFDIGFDGRNIGVMEYNSDSSAALLETADTQDLIAKHYGFDRVGRTSGGAMYEAMIDYWKGLYNSSLCPPTKTVHFMVDDDDEERYTALTVMHCAKEAGFKCKFCIKLVDFRYASGFGPANTGAGDANLNEPFVVGSSPPQIVDLDGTPVFLIWKTWSWTTVITDFEKQAQLRSAAAQQQQAAGGATADAAATASAAGSASSATGGGTSSNPRPTLSDVFLSRHAAVIEPFWKSIAGNKGLLPFVFEAGAQHSALLRAEFQPSEAFDALGGFVRKPVHGRAGQNVTIHASGTDGSTPLEHASGGNFGDDVVVYQQRINIQKFGDYYPIVGAWVIGSRFVGAAVREDKSRVTTLSSCVAPVRVVREREEFEALEAKDGVQHAAVHQATPPPSASD